MKNCVALPKCLSLSFNLTLSEPFTSIPWLDGTRGVQSLFCKIRPSRIVETVNFQSAQAICSKPTEYGVGVVERSGDRGRCKSTKFLTVLEQSGHI
ncbi:hypothetical protein M0802_008149 [Mischocyttarus mexicanus]|nr:hypothetical protein M0802_008149 [Mischocyttarus mexicanus]